MRGFVVYTHMQFKRVARYVPFVFLTALALCSCLILATVTMVSNDSDADNTKLPIGVVGDYEDSYFGFGLSAIKSLDSSRFSLDIIELSEENAKKALLNGSVSGYVVIPDGFVENAMRGDVGKLIFVTNDAAADLLDIFKQEVLELISRILVESQNGIYGMQAAMSKYNPDIYKISDLTDVMMVDYIGMILNRSNAVETQIIGVAENLTFGGYMFSGIIILFILLLGIVTCPVFIKSDMSLSRVLRANGYSCCMQILSEYLSFFAVITATTAVMLFGMMAGAGKIADIIPELSLLSMAETVDVIVKFIPAIALITAMQFFMYQLADSVVSGVIMQFVCAVVLGYASGCFYPISFFPKSIQVLSNILPSGIARGFLSSLIIQSDSLKQTIIIILYAVLLLAIAAFVRHRRIKNE